MGVPTDTLPATARREPSLTLATRVLTALRWTRTHPRDPLLPRVATTTMPGPSRLTVSTPIPDGASPTTPSLPSPTTTRSTPARFRLTTTSGLRTTTAGPPRTRRATATPPLPTSTLLLASTSPTLMLLPMATDTVTDITDMPDTATATVTDGEQFPELMMCIRSQIALSE